MPFGDGILGSVCRPIDTRAEGSAVGGRRLSAVYPKLRTPDALQLAAALSTRCGALVTNDRELPPVAGLEVLQLSGNA